MEKLSRREYQLVRENQTEGPENEIKIKGNRRRFPYVAYILKLLKEKDHEKVVLLASGKAIDNLLEVVDLLRQRVENVHTSLAFEVTKRKLRFEPREEYKEEKEVVEKTKMKTSMTATVSLKALDEIVKHSNYMPPMESEDLIRPDEFDNIVKEYNDKDNRRPRRNDEEEDEDRPRRRGRRANRGGRRANRGGRGSRGRPRRYEDEEDRPRRGGRRGNRGGRRGSRGRGQRDD